MKTARKLLIHVQDQTMTATLENNSSVDALCRLLQEGPVTVEMEDYARMEKVGSLGRRLPTNDRNITTTAGDLILYQGCNFVIYYAPNTWSFTKLGHIDGVSAKELKDLLGRHDVMVTLELAEQG